MRLYTEIPCNKFNARFVLSPEAEQHRATLQAICSNAQTHRDLIVDLDEWVSRERATAHRRFDIGVLESRIGHYRSFIITEIKTINEPRLIPGS